MALTGYKLAYDYFIDLQKRKKLDAQVMQNRKRQLSTSLSKLLLTSNHTYTSRLAEQDLKKAIHSLKRGLVNGMHRGNFMHMLDSVASDRYEEIRSQNEVPLFSQKRPHN